MTSPRPAVQLCIGTTAALLLFAVPTQAQDAPVPQELIVTSSRMAIPQRQIGTSVSVIDAADIEARGNLALTDILRQLPAMQVSSNGGVGKATSLRIRGEEGFRTLTILDGMRLSDPSAPQIGPQLQHLISSGIHRVEILRGPQGLAYGADAGGVVNISTRSGAQGLQGSLDAQAGKFGTRQLSGTLAGGNTTADFFASAARLETEGYNVFAGDDVFMDKDGYQNESLHLRGGLNLGEGWRAELVHRLVESESLYDNCFSPTMDGNDCLDLFELSATRLALSHQNGHFSHSLSYNRTDTDRNSYSSGSFSFGGEGELERWEYVGSATGLPGFKVAFGADLEEALNNRIGRQNAGAYVEYLSDFSERFFVTAGIRHDDNDDFGTNTSHRVSSAYLIDMGSDATLKLKGSVGTGFRAPSPYEIAFNAGPWASPPASDTILQQETSEGWEVGLELATDAGLRLAAVYFDQDVENAIEFDPVAFSGYLQLLGISTSEGVELSGEWELNDSWRFIANFTHNETARPNGLQRQRRPEQLYNVGISWRGLEERLNINAFLRASRDAIDEMGGMIVPLDDFEVMDLSGAFSLTDGIQLYGRIENLLNEDYREVAEQNTPGRAAYLGLRMSFQNL